MTDENLKLALQLNNKKINDEINNVISYLNAFATNQKILHENIDDSLSSLDSALSSSNANLLYKISLVNTQLNDLSYALNNAIETHISDTVVHITQDERNKWNSIANYTDNTVKSHAENLVIHVTQEDKDLWNASLQNAKDYAKSLFDQVTNFNIVKCQTLPTEDIQTMTIYFLQIDPEQNDLYEEYMYIDNAWEKIGNTRIDLSDYVTKTLLQSEIDTINQTITTKESTINQTILDKETAINLSISNLESKHDSDIQDINDLIDNLESDIDDLDSDINALITEQIEQVTQLIDTLESKHDQDIQDINTDLTNNYQPKLHEHSNKTLLDKLSIDANNNLLYDGAKVCNLTGLATLNDLANYALKTDLHEHDNKTLLDKFSVDSNGNLLFDNSPIIDSSAYVTSTDVANAISNALLNYVTNTNLVNTLNNYALKTDIPTVPDLTPYALKSEIPTIPDLTDYALKSDIPDLPDLSSLHEHDNKDILDKLSEDEDDNLLFNGNPISTNISSRERNAIQKLEDGLYVPLQTNNEIYSAQEEISGKWIDNSDVYTITKMFTVSDSTNQEIAHGISINSIIQFHAHIIHNGNCINLNYYDGTDFIDCQMNDTNILLNKSTSNLFNNDKLHIYVKYVKQNSNYYTSDNKYILTSDDKIFTAF